MPAKKPIKSKSEKKTYTKAKKKSSANQKSKKSASLVKNDNKTKKKNNSSFLWRIKKLNTDYFEIMIIILKKNVRLIIIR